MTIEQQINQEALAALERIRFMTPDEYTTDVQQARWKRLSEIAWGLGRGEGMDAAGDYIQAMDDNLETDIDMKNRHSIMTDENADEPTDWLEEYHRQYHGFPGDACLICPAESEAL